MHLLGGQFACLNMAFNYAGWKKRSSLWNLKFKEKSPRGEMIVIVVLRRYSQNSEPPRETGVPQKRQSRLLLKGPADTRWLFLSSHLLKWLFLIEFLLYLQLLTFTTFQVCVTASSDKNAVTSQNTYCIYAINTLLMKLNSAPSVKLSLQLKQLSLELALALIT